MSKSWTIVKFLHDRAVEAVPSSWIEDHFCVWPASMQFSRLATALERCEPINNTWPKYEITIFANATFDDYAKARSKAEEMNDLQSEKEAAVKRKRILKHFSTTDSESSTEMSLPKPPKIIKIEKLDRSINVILNTDKNNDITEKIHIVIEDVDKRPTCSGCALHSKNMETLVNENHLLRTVVVESLEEIKRVREQMETFTAETKNFINEMQRGRAERKEENASIFQKYTMKFPLNSLEEIEQFEEILNNEGDFNNGVNELAKFGGSGIYDFVKRTLSALISNEIALQFSWLGRSGKKKFNTLNLARLIICAADKAKIGVSHKEAEETVQRWLKRASDRKSAMCKKY